jgi:hypothetical protein
VFDYFVTAYLICFGQPVVWEGPYLPTPQAALSNATAVAKQMHCKVRVFIIEEHECSETISYETNPRRYPKEIRIPTSKF